MANTDSGDVSVMFIVGLIIGIFMGFLAAVFVISYNNGIHDAENRKQLVQLGVGSYDSRTGGFVTKACGR